MNIPSGIAYSIYALVITIVAIGKFNYFCSGMLLKYTFLVFWFYPFVLRAQIIESPGQSPWKLKWRQIQTPHFRIIYPEEMDSVAQRTANAMMNAYRDVAKSLNVLPRKIPIVLQNQTTDNNAFVTSEGRRAEFFSTPPQNPQNMGMNNWFDELSLHEYRHVVQMDHTIQGWGKYIFYLFGNSGTSVMQGLTNPWWFWEGDAVGIESVLGYGGRGRIPAFDLTFRTQLLSRGAFSYIKASCGSMKNAIPNHYLLGYLMTTYVKNHYGADVWEKILDRTYRTPPLPFCFSNSMKKITGLNANQAYVAMTEELKDLWGQQVSNVKETPVTYFHQPKEKVFSNYKFPQYLSDGSIVAQKAGLETGSFLAYKSSIVDQSAFVLLTNDGKEKRICMSGVLDDNGIMSCAGNKVVWTEYSYDPRWGARNYTVVKTLDVKTNKQKQLTHRSRLHAPCFSPNGTLIAAIEYTTACKYFLVLMDGNTGALIRKFPNPENLQLLQPHFTSDGKNILLIIAEAGSKSIVKVNLETGTVSTVLPSVPENISAPADYKNYVLFNSPRSGTDNIYAIDTITGQQYRVTNRKYGAFNACVSPDNTTLCFQDFMPDGFRIATIPIDVNTWEKIDTAENSANKVEYYKRFAQQEAGNILSRIPDSVYPSARYNKLKHAINIYSWGAEPLSNLPRLLNIGVKSQDMLSTTLLEAGFSYDNNEKQWGKYAKLSYNGFYPEFFISYTDGKRKAIFSKGEAGAGLAYSVYYDLIAFRNFNFGTALPLNFSSGAYIRNLVLKSQVVYNSFNKLVHQPDENQYKREYFGNFFSLQHDISFEWRLRQSIRDVGPRAGVITAYSFRNAPFHSFFNASQTAVNINVYLPGFFKHHAATLRACLQRDDSSNYHFENRFLFVRNVRDQLFHHLQIYSIDYKLPLCYPDLSVLNGFLYFQRLKLDVFSEWAVGKSLYNDLVDGHLRRYTNVGMEFMADVNFMRFLIPFEAGIRSTYLAQDHSLHHQAIIKLPVF
ncbi:TolB family protein [Niastella vici]|uniref:TolB family protein n=1 Tax=Niastella vici TaxID=1703345 RepID=UPI001C1F8011|nr:hypothetical protein [Niastella vici]